MLSIDVTTANIRIVEAEYRAGAIAVSKFDTVPTPEGCVKNGIIINSQELANRLTECIKKNKVKSKKVVITINSSAVVTRELTVPCVKEKEMRGLLRNEIEQMASAKQDYILDYSILERMRVDDADVYRVLCIVVPRLIVESYRDLVERHLGLQAYRFDVQPHVIHKLACLDQRMEATGAVVLADIGSDEMRLNLVEGGSKIFNLTTPISVTSDVVESEYILSSIGKENMMSDQVKQERVAATAAESISKLVQFQTMKNKGNPVRAILLCGGRSSNKAFVDLVSENLGREVGVITPPSFIQCPEGLEFNKYISAVCAVITL